MEADREVAHEQLSAGAAIEPEIRQQDSHGSVNIARTLRFDTDGEILVV